MGFIFLILSFYGYLIFLIRYSKWSTASMPLFIISTGIIVLFASGFLDLLQPTLWCFIGLGICLGFISLCAARKNLIQLLTSLLEPGPVIFFLLACFFYIKLSGALFEGWDEFTHWGFSAKEMFHLNSFTKANSPLMFKSYPPGTALFQYWITKSIGWSEGNTYWAQSLLVLAGAVAILEGLTWRQWIRIILTLNVVFLAVFIFGYSLQSLYVDHVLGFLCGASVISCIRSNTSAPITIVRLLPTLFILPIIKAVGLMLGIFIAIIFVFDQIFKEKNIFSVSKPLKKKLIFGFLVILILATPIISARIWGWHVKKSGFSQVFETSFSISQIKKSFSSTEATDRDKETISTFKKAFQTYQINPENVLQIFSRRFVLKLTPLKSSLFLMVFGIAAIVIETRRQERRIAIVGFLTMFSGYTIYSFGLLLMYLYSFGSYEGTRVASFTRYMGIFLLAWTIVTWGFMLSTGEQKEKNSPKIVQGLLVIFILFLTPIKAALFAFTKPKPLPVRMEIKKILSNTIPNLKRGEKVYVIWQNTTGFEPWIVSYELSPRNSTSVANSGWSLGLPYYEGDVWTSDIHPKTWSENILVNYDFLLLASVDEYFWSRYASIFKPTLNLKSNKLFRIVKKENGKINLEIVDLTSNSKSVNRID
ncbi:MULTISPECIES: hypothetical protein [Leptospira]|uniref:Uncharacterized protein n=1 Tax=Leptospira kirschneri serovar Pomona TaxID=561005 RepID=A0A1T1DSC4_9LEPT|nr:MULTISPECIES: hypothetical protein [Leptospira]EMK10232.1 putative membrane protein [Leptospira kirschneri]KXZ29270.1 hypothetical protein AYB32_10275 [Leptospira kirschneri]KXZ33963.1 hypothetical protein AYB34_09275 [Leptospira sp. ZV016]OOV43755.1 hypothetical protein B1J93_07085 [Leptospira kirschneri serovar Pomona]